MKHTRGPWIIRDCTRNDVCLPQAQRSARFYGVVDNSGMPIAEMHIGNLPANARLIAAAPELFEELEIAVNTIETLTRGKPNDAIMALLGSMKKTLKNAGGK